MTFLIACFAAGIALAAWRAPSPAGRRLASRGTLAGLAVLLALMGARIGSSPEILGTVGTLGMKAAILAAGAIAGSVLLVWAFSRSLQRASPGAPPEESRDAAPDAALPGAPVPRSGAPALFPDGGMAP